MMNVLRAHVATWRHRASDELRRGLALIRRIPRPASQLPRRPPAERLPARVDPSGNIHIDLEAARLWHHHFLRFLDAEQLALAQHEGSPPGLPAGWGSREEDKS